MRYTDEEIKNKFSNVNFDKTGWKKQAVFNKIVAKQAGRSFNMRKRYLALTAVSAAVIVFVAAPHLINNFKQGSQGFYKADIPMGESRQTLEAETLNQAQGGIEKSAGEIFIVKDEYEPQVQEAMPAPMPARKTLSVAAKGAYSPLSFEAGPISGANVTRSAVRYAVNIRQGTQYRAQTQNLAKEIKDYTENSFKKAALEPLSTFSADVDTASYSMLKSQINNGWTVQKDGVKIEALINNFAYNYPKAQGADPLAINIEYSDSPWDKNNKLVKIGVKAKELDKANLPQSNLVFLIDVSGSMAHNNALPMVKQAFKMLLEQLSPEDVVSVVTYASGVQVRLDGVKAKDKAKIAQVIDGLYASGATYGEEGLKKAYEIAKKNFILKGNNRIIIASDGDFNVGRYGTQDLEKQVSQAKESGVFISALGFGMGNYRDALMETIADKGNGNYAYIDDLKTAQKALVREFAGTIFTVAKDVKFQVEFNPAKVEDYRLIGYEKRALNNEDFNDDKKDAGEIGSGHSVTVLYEIRPKGAKEALDIDGLKYSSTKYNNTDEVLTVKIRYKAPDGDESKLISKALKEKEYKPFDKTSEDFRFASAAAAFGQNVKDSVFKGNISLKEIADIAAAAKGLDENGDRAEFVQLIRTYAAAPAPRESAAEPADDPAGEYVTYGPDDVTFVPYDDPEDNPYVCGDCRSNTQDIDDPANNPDNYIY